MTDSTGGAFALKPLEKNILYLGFFRAALTGYAAAPDGPKVARDTVHLAAAAALCAVQTAAGTIERFHEENARMVAEAVEAKRAAVKRAAAAAARAAAAAARAAAEEAGEGRR